VYPWNTILQLSTSYTDTIPQIPQLYNHRRWYHLANTLKQATANKRTVQNFHVRNSHRQHAARLFQTTPYNRLILTNSWATCGPLPPIVCLFLPSDFLLLDVAPFLSLVHVHV